MVGVVGYMDCSRDTLQPMLLWVGMSGVLTRVSPMPAQMLQRHQEAADSLLHCGQRQQCCCLRVCPRVCVGELTCFC